MTEVYPNSRLNATSTDPSSAKDRKNCAIKCLWNPFCKSFDFCGRKLCLVHDEDVYTVTYLIHPQNLKEYMLTY